MKLLHTYKALSKPQKAIVDILAAAYVAISRTNLSLCLGKCRILNPQGNRFKAKELDPLLKELISEGLVEIRDILFCITPHMADPICRSLAASDEFDTVAAAVQSAMPLGGRKRYETYDPNLLIRDIRIGIFNEDADHVVNVIANNVYMITSEMGLPHPYGVISRIFPDWDWLEEKLPRELLAKVILGELETIEYDFAPIDQRVIEILDKFKKETTAKPFDQANTRILLAQHHLLKGEPAPAEKLLEDLDDINALTLKGFSAFLAGKNDAAISLYETAFALLKKSTRKRKIYFENSAGIFYLIALLRSGIPQNRETARAYAEIAAKRYIPNMEHFSQMYHYLVWLIDGLQGDPTSIGMLSPNNISKWNISDFHKFFLLLCRHWLNLEINKAGQNLLKELTQKMSDNGYHWLAMESAELLSRTYKRNTPYRKRAVEFRNKSGIRTMVDLMGPEEKWKGALDALIQLKHKKPLSPALEKSARLAWFFDFNKHYQGWDMSPREQRLSKKGTWSKGRPIALKRLVEELDAFDYFTPQDKKICAHLVEEVTRNYYGYREYSYFFADGALLALVGHPHIFKENSPEVRLELVKGEPELFIHKKNQGKIRLELAGDVNFKEDVCLIEETPTRIKIIELNDDIKEVAKIIGKGVTVPAAAENQIAETMNSLSSILTIHSELSGFATALKKIPADPTPHIHLMPAGKGLKIDMLTRPFADGGPYFRPGSGGQTVVAEINGRRLQTQRNLREETRLADKIAAGVPALSALSDSMEEVMAWRLDDPEDCLETLMALEALGKEVVVEWPEGRSFSIKQQVDSKQFHLRVKKQQEWFEVSGELRLDENLVLSMEQLIALLEKTPGRFIPLKTGEFLALTNAFRKRLEEIKAYSEKSAGGRKFHPLSALMLNDMADELGRLNGDKHWKAHVKRLKDAQQFTPRLPSTFKADLREYQQEGVDWLGRLNHWGVGACLADDMGLGKTIQALAAILTRAPEGPSLVVAPTSVCMNWELEARRFAPTLNVVFLSNGDRDETVARLKPFDLLVVSYGLLQQEKIARLLRKAAFQTIVLDEAQAIKNATTKRSKAAMKLNGRFKIITTGTPIENNLSELWNLFHFINPGLLGSLDAFNRKYALPIEKNQKQAPRKRLKRLIHPFILRRTKHQVLEELPPRTEITLTVELSKEETAFYEALRQRALTHLAQDDAPMGQKHLKILAEIMRLRRACCSPRLVDEQIELSSAKQALFQEVVAELLAGGHKALVFSQFVGHLALLRDYVEKEGITYQYLDGATPAGQRKKRVEAFQSGDGDLFLISLKAGGLGLNLTAADYVIHMDPWWNPAVEDQAADRAHRIGQQRPVTVYRLVAKDTIEEKIVALHRSKRDLADTLLEGADMSGKMSADELLKLIQEG